MKADNSEFVEIIVTEIKTQANLMSAFVFLLLRDFY